MNTLLIIIVICIIGGLSAALIVMNIRHSSERHRLMSELSTAHEEVARLQERERLIREESARLQAQSDERFKAIASGILMQNSSELRQQNTAGLEMILKPLKENIENFRRTITERYEREHAERYSLGERVRELMELNATIGRETRRLTDALKGNSKIQGDWGEMILENILERCGLRRDYEYTVQTSTTNDEGRRLRPDVIINYTEGRKIVVDSKVSLQAYLDMLNTDDDGRRQSLGRDHVNSVKKHIAELGSKSYQDAAGVSGVDFVLMFIPHEGAYLAAMQLDSHLWETAYDAKVLIISPTHLMSIVRLVEQMLRHDKQNRNAMDIARQAGFMLDKFRGFLEDMDRIDKSINSARDAWNSAYSKLNTGTGNLISRASRLSELGAKPKRPLPPRYQTDETEAEEEDSN